MSQKFSLLGSGLQYTRVIDDCFVPCCPWRSLLYSSSVCLTADTVFAVWKLSQCILFVTTTSVLKINLDSCSQVVHSLVTAKVAKDVLMMNTSSRIINNTSKALCCTLIYMWRSSRIFKLRHIVI